jgi:lactobin A/cerein 7B family class IIb bacteriocin
MASYITDLNNEEIDMVAGGPWPLVARAVGWAVTSGAAAGALNELAEFGEKIHDAVCKH